jgi:hypothetical protein
MLRYQAEARRGGFVDELLDIYCQRSFLPRLPELAERRAKLLSWWLRVLSGDKATLEFPGESAATVRVAIEKNTSGVPFDIQLNQPHYPVMAGQRLAVSFRARADVARSINVAFSMGRHPWSSLGLYRSVSVLSEWRAFREEFEVTEQDADARIHFDLGHESPSVELADVEVRDIDSGELVNPWWRHSTT